MSYSSFLGYIVDPPDEVVTECKWRKTWERVGMVSSSFTASSFQLYCSSLNMAMHALMCTQVLRGCCGFCFNQHGTPFLTCFHWSVQMLSLLYKQSRWCGLYFNLLDSFLRENTIYAWILKRCLLQSSTHWLTTHTIMASSGSHSGGLQFSSYVLKTWLKIEPE